MRRVCAVAAVAAIFLLLAPGAAVAKEFTLPAAEVDARILDDGAVRVTERITYAFSGRFSGGFREVPLRPGEDLVDVAVSEEGTAYTPGASAALGSEGSPGTFGTARTGDGVRIVWHYAAADESRTFTIEYTLTGLAVAWDDVVDVYLQVWGDEWEAELSSLRARVRVPRPGGEGVLVWGTPQG